MAKIQIKSEKLTPFGGIFSIMEQFDALLAQTIDSTLVSCYNGYYCDKTQTSKFAYFQRILQYEFAYFRIFHGNKFAYFQYHSYLCTA